MTFAANAGVGTQACTNIPIIDDNLVEIDEEFALTANVTDNQVTFPNGTSASVLILDNESETLLICYLISEHYIGFTQTSHVQLVRIICCP